MLQFLNKKILNFLVIIVLSFITFWWTSFIFHLDMAWNVIATIIGFRILASLLIFKDFSLSWSKSTQKTFLIKTIVVGVPTVISMGVFYGNVRLAFLISEASFYLVSISLAMYSYYYYINRSGVSKTKSLVIYGAGKAGSILAGQGQKSNRRKRHRYSFLRRRSPFGN